MLADCQPALRYSCGQRAGNARGFNSDSHRRLSLSIAVYRLRGGADIRHVQAFLGYAELDTTKIYLRLVPGHLWEDYDRAMPELAACPLASQLSMLA